MTLLFAAKDHANIIIVRVNRDQMLQYIFTDDVFEGMFDDFLAKTEEMVPKQEEKSLFQRVTSLSRSNRPNFSRLLSGESLVSTDYLLCFIMLSETNAMLSDTYVDRTQLAYI
jgi:hypothetical protein